MRSLLALVLLVGCAESGPGDPVVVDDACTEADGTCVRTGMLAPTADADAIVRDTSALPSRYPFWILQMNLCNSGVAKCYDGGASVPEGASVIRSTAPDVVTLNEICEPDVAQLARALGEVYSGSTVVWAFKAAQDRNSGAAYKCKNGASYGIGLIAHVPAPYNGHQVFSGIYAAQDTRSAEERAWLCLYATGNYYACTTHLASTSGSVAMSQCKDLMSNLLPAVKAAGGASAPTVVGGDLNMKYRGSPNAQDCVPAGFYRKGDGDVQHILASTDLAFASSRSIGMAHTDHDAWFIATTAP